MATLAGVIQVRVIVIGDIFLCLNVSLLDQLCCIIFNLSTYMYINYLVQSTCSSVRSVRLSYCY